MTRYLPRLRWWIGGLLFASTVINYIDRQTLSVLAPFLKRDYHWSNTDFATVLIAFRIAYTIGQGTIGRILDKLGTRRGLSLTVMFYSVVATLTATAQGVGSFRFFRFLLGAGEAANWPGATKAVSEVDVLIPCLWGLTLSLPGNPSAPTGTHVIRKRSVRAGLLLLLACCIGSAQLADTVMLGGKILVLDGAGRTVQALAIRGGRIVALGSDAEMRPYTGQRTKVIPLNGHMVVPGLIESHAHALGVAREEHDQPYAELSSIPEVQAWIRTRAKQVPPGTWIRVPRNDLTRLKERRHPTPAELDAACTTHPVIFTAVMKNTFNTAGWRALGITPQTKEFHRGQIVRDSAGGQVLLVGADSYIQSTIAAPKLTHSEMLEELPKVLTKYSEVGITAIGERRTDVEGFRTYQDLEKLGRLPVRATVAINLPERTPEKIEAYVRKIGVKQGDGDDWVKVGILKLAADGGIHWGTTALGEPYGLKRMSFYRLTDPDYRGFYYNTDQQLRDIFETANRIGWQVGIHATGDAAVEQVLNAVEAADRKQSVRPRRFTLIHAYFPAPDLIARAHRLGMCVDTQPILYYKDSDAIAEVYGQKWAERFIGVGDWVRAGIPTAINSDHMIGFDPNDAMNSYNPFLAMYIAVTRKNQNGRTYGPEQRISRVAALRAMTSMAAYLDFNENKIGSLQVGKFADLAVLDRDYLTCPEEEIRAIKVLMTMVNGKLVYERTLTASAR